MLGKIPSLTRLFLCLLLSAVLHGGLTYYGKMASPAGMLQDSAPVEVSLRPVVDVIPSEAVEVNHEPQPGPLPPKKKPVKKVQKVDRIKAVAAVESLPVTNAAKENIECVQATEALCADSLLVQTDELVGVQASGETAELPEPYDSGLQGPEDEVSLILPESAIVEAVPSYSSNPLPEYPYLARQRHWEGVVWLLVDVAADGSVDDLHIEQSSGYKILDRSALRAVKRWRFSPGTRGGLPVASKAKIPVRFQLEGS